LSFLNPAADAARAAALRVPARDSLAFHRGLEGYAATPLLDVPSLAGELGLERLWVKDESARFGLPSFKPLGASWAIACELSRRAGGGGGGGGSDGGGLPPRPAPHADLRAAFAAVSPRLLVAPTDGNHGRAVARFAARWGFGAHVLVPAGTARARIEAIEGEGARVTVVPGSYDEAVEAAAALEGEAIVISDTAWAGYERVPERVIGGYSTMLWEISDELAARGEPPPDAVAVQIGVGALAAAVVAHVRHWDGGGPGPGRALLLGVEPADAACALASVRAGRPTLVPGPHRSVMAGLNCGLPAAIAFDALRLGVDAYVTVEDGDARAARADLERAGIASGESGAAGLAGLRRALAEPLPGGTRRPRPRSALVLNTEAPTA
jgi:diaminopropionate ammonia-lyase